VLQELRAAENKDIVVSFDNLQLGTTLTLKATITRGARASNLDL